MPKIIEKHDAAKILFSAADLRELLILMAYRASDDAAMAKLRKVWREHVAGWMK